MKDDIAKRLLVALCVMGLIVPACGGGGGGGDEDTTDTIEEDPGTDLGTDPTPDPEPDTEEDPTGDTEEDPVEDTEEDASEDPPAEWPTDLPADWPYETGDECATAGGFCTSARWVLCPVGYEPIDPDPNRDCGTEGMGGWCCVVAPYSECSASGRGNCIAATSCEGCWSAVDLACESGRVCCEDICD